MFSFFLVLSVGWLFVAERKHGTLVRLLRLRSRVQILLGKLLPCLAISLIQGFFLLAAGAAHLRHDVGLASGVTASARVLYLLRSGGVWRFSSRASPAPKRRSRFTGTLIVLVLGGVSGSLCRAT